MIKGVAFLVALAITLLFTAALVLGLSVVGLVVLLALAAGAFLFWRALEGEIR